MMFIMGGDKLLNIKENSKTAKKMGGENGVIVATTLIMKDTLKMICSMELGILTSK